MTSDTTYASVCDPFTSDVQEASGSVERHSAFTRGFTKLPILIGT